MSQTFTVPLIQQGMATTDTFNAPLTYIQQALNSLSSDISSLANKSAVIQWEAPVSAQVNAGDLVYFNTSTGLFEPAKAGIASQTGSQGQSVETPSSRVQGLVLAVKASENSATLLKSGYYEDAVITATIGVGAESGIYFLSPTNAGKATKTPGWNMRQPVLSYYGDGKFSMFANYLAHDNHHHASYTVPSWTAAESYTDQSAVPSGANYFYTIPNQAMFGDMSQVTTAVFIDGKLNTQDFIFDTSVIWYKGQEVPANNSVVLFNSYPFAYGDAVVRSFKSSSLSVTNNNGNVVVNMPQYVRTTGTGSSYAVSDITQNRMTLNPVVSRVVQGAGIKITNKGNGGYQISALSQTGQPKPATEITLNNTERVNSGLLTYTVFPGGRDSSVVITLPISFVLQDSYTASVSVWATTRGPGAGTIDVSLYWIPYKGDNASTQITIPNSPIGTGTLRSSNLSVSKLTYIESKIAQGISMTSPGVLVAELKTTAPSFDLYMHQAGFIVDAQTNSEQENSDASDVTREQIMNVLEDVLTFNANH